MKVVNRSADREMWVDFARVYDGLTYGDLEDAFSGHRGGAAPLSGGG